MSERSVSAFRERARVEADRYGPDPWIFVRELLQNARDAGARAVTIAIEETPRGTRIHCRDDGEGMSYEHARRYLFSLYASSKEDRANQVGRFGVGFWSILRFEPTRIVIRSRPRDGAGSGWQVVLDGALQRAERSEFAMDPGTEVILERGSGDGSNARRVWEAGQQNARFLCMRDDPERPLPVVIDGRTINAEFALPAPSAAFRRGRVRGVVGLGLAPRVELFSRGLRVRSAACLDDLLTSSGHTAHSRVMFPELPGGLAPQALVESEGLDLLLSRTDARDTRTLRRLVELGQTELRSLVERQLARIRPPGLGERLAGLMRRVVGESTWWRAVLGATTGAILAALIAQILWPSRGHDSATDRVRAGSDAPARPSRRAYSDLSARYDGPQVSELDAAGEEPLALSYSPRDARPYFAALIIQDVGGAASGTASATSTRYPRSHCEAECLTIELPLVADAGALPLPMPSGHRLDTGSVVFIDRRGRQQAAPLVVVDDAGQPAVLLDGEFVGTVHYTTGPGPALAPPGRGRLGDDVSGELSLHARALRGLEPDDRVDAAIDLVRSRVRYSTRREIAERHEAAKRAGTQFVERALEIGAGDCDVQNGLLVAVLHDAGIDARLAVGWVGDRGGVSPWLHAWVEWLDANGQWAIADATGRELDGVVAGLPPSPSEVAVGSVRELDPSAEPTAVQPESDPAAVAPSEAIAGDGLDDHGPGEPSEPGSEPDRESSGWRPGWLAEPWLPWVATTLSVLGLALLWSSVARRTTRRINLGETNDLSALLQGALAQPGAFRHLPALFHRRLIAVRGGGAISLERARTLAGRGRLYVGRDQTDLSRTARRRGAVLDGDTPEARMVAASLAAIDLDRWGHRLARGQDSPVLAAVSQHLREHGERWRIVAVRNLGDEVATLDLGPLRSRRRLGDRLVLVDAADPCLVETEQLRASRPHTATFTLLDHLLEHLHLAPERRARLLAPLADRALAEQART